MLLQLMSDLQITQVHSSEIVPVTLYKTPAAPAPLKTIAPKKSAPPVKTAKPFENNLNSISASIESAISTNHVQPSSTETPSTQSAPTLSILPPPSATYLLDVVRTEPKLANPYYGSGEIRWRNNGTSYSMQIEAGIDVLFTTVRLYSMQSEGRIDGSGIKPRIATEARRGRATTNTYFNYDNHSISFSVSPDIIPLSENAQDKATVLMQLAGMGNADPTQFQAGKPIAVQVAEEKEAHTHQFTVLGQETLDTSLGKLTAWHIVRPPRPGQYSSCIDIWLAPELGWLPVQIRNTEANGAITTQTIRKITEGLSK